MLLEVFYLFHLIQSLTIDLSCQPLARGEFEVRPYAGRFGYGVCEGSTLTWRTYDDSSCSKEALVTTDIYPMDRTVCMQTSPATQVDHRYLDFLRDLEGFFGCMTSPQFLRFNETTPCINPCSVKNECLELSSEKLTSSCVNQPNSTKEALSASRECKNRHLITSYYQQNGCSGNWTSKVYQWWEFSTFYEYIGSSNPTVWQFQCDEKDESFSKAAQNVVYTEVETVNSFTDFRIHSDQCFTNSGVSWQGLACVDGVFTYIYFPDSCNNTYGGEVLQVKTTGGCNNKRSDLKFGIGKAYRAWCVNAYMVRIQECDISVYSADSPPEKMVSMPDDSPRLLDPYSPVWFIIMCVIFGMIFCIIAALCLKFCFAYKEFLVDSSFAISTEYNELHASPVHNLWSEPSTSIN